MEENNKSIGNNNSILNDHRSTDSNNTSNSHNVSTHSIDNHSVDSHDTHIVNQNGYSMNDVEKIVGMIQKAKEEGRQEVIEQLHVNTQQPSTAPVPYSSGEPKSPIKPIPGSEKYHEPLQPSQPSHPKDITTPPPTPFNFRRLLLVFVAIVVVGIVAHGIGGLFKKAESEEKKEVAQTEVVNPQQQKPSQAKKTSTGPTKKPTNTQQTVSASKPTTKKVTTTKQQLIQSQQPQIVTPKVNPFTEAKAKADAGDATSCYKVAQAYMNGDGVAKNLQSAFLYMKTAAEQGYTPAYIEIAKMYHGGRGITKNRDIAEQWYKKAANAGNAEARRILLNM